MNEELAAAVAAALEGVADGVRVKLTVSGLVYVAWRGAAGEIGVECAGLAPKSAEPAAEPDQTEPKSPPPDDATPRHGRNQHERTTRR